MCTQFIFITGSAGIGKTSIVKRLAADVNKQQWVSYRSLSGFYTEEVLDAAGKRIGFDAVLLNETGDRCVLARRTPIELANRSAPLVGRYRVHVSEFEDLVRDSITTECDCLIIDEIGKMELQSTQFCEQIAGLLSHRTADLVVATIPLRGGGQLVDQLRQQRSAKLFTVTTANRNTIYNDIAQHVFTCQEKQ